MDCSFAPSGQWFVFDDAGQTLRSGLKTKRAAVQWMHDKLHPQETPMAKKPSKPPSKPMSYGKPKGGRGGKGGRSC